MPCIRTVGRGTSSRGSAQLRSDVWHPSSPTMETQATENQLQVEPGGFHRPFSVPTSRRTTTGRTAPTGIRTDQIVTYAPRRRREVVVLLPSVCTEAAAAAD